MRKENLFALVFLLFAISAPAKANPNQSSNVRETYQEALSSASQNRFDDAIAQLQRVLRSDSSFTTAYLLLASFHDYNNSEAKGRLYFEQAIEANPNEPNNYAGLAALCGLADDTDAAFEQAQLALSHGSRSPRVVEILVEAAIKLQRTNTLASVLQSLRRKTEQKQLYDLGYAIWRLRSKNKRRAEKNIQNYLQESPDDAAGYLLLAKLEFENENMTAGRTAIRKALALANPLEKQFLVEANAGLAESFRGAVFDSSTFYYGRALKIANESGLLRERVRLRLTLADVHLKHQEPHEAVNLCQQGIALLQNSRQTDDLRGLFFGLARAYDMCSESVRASTYYEKVLSLARTAGDREMQAGIYLALGLQYRSLHRFPRAIDYFSQSFKIGNDIDADEVVSQSLLARADTKNEMGDFENARSDYEVVIRYAQNRQELDLVETCLLKLANMYYRLQNYEEADDYLARADALGRQTFQLQYAANHRWMQGKVSLAEGNIEAAETYFLHAIELGKESGSYLAFLAGQSGLVKTYLQTEYHDMAVAHADTALRYLDELLELCTSEPTFEFFDLKNDLIIPAANAYAAVGKLDQMYFVAEMSKSIERLFENREAQLTTENPLVTAARKESRDAIQRIREGWQMLWNVWRRDRSDNLALIAEGREKIGVLHTKYQEYMADLAKSHPEVAQLFKPIVQPLHQTQAELRELHATLLHYLIGENAMFVIVVMPDGVQCTRVNVNRSTLETYIREVNPLFGRSENNFGVVGVPPVTGFRVDQLAILHKLLIEPVRQWLPAGGTVIVSPDDVLSALPLDILVTNPDALIDKYDYANARFLIEDFPIAYVPSAAFLGNCAAKDRQKSGILALANAPGETESVANGKHPTNGHTNGVTAETTLMGKESLTEIKSIAPTMAELGSDVVVGENATRERFLADAPDYEVIHLAVPFKLNDLAPLHSELVFSRNLDSRIDAYELFNQKLSADMAVLSLCDTSNGQFNSESCNRPGLLGFVNGFRQAGVPSVLANRWPTSPEIRSTLLADFYANLKLGRNKAEALQEAKLAELARAENRNPYQWAGLVLYGNTSAIEFKTSQRHLMLYWGVAVILIFVALFAKQVMKLRKDKWAG